MAKLIEFRPGRMTGRNEKSLDPHFVFAPEDLRVFGNGVEAVRMCRHIEKMLNRGWRYDAATDRIMVDDEVVRECRHV